ncbi:MAG TPA: restriction endonuclease, partial [Terriglobia bacterium]|nr:restriction endonuclease [Terriglobia bacterium]
MSNDGKHLEGLVAIVERILLPDGFEVKTNERIYDDGGVQIAEFDIEICGKVGTTTIYWLIECRDRPGNGAAPASWIEQLVGRRGRFGFNKVTAVSTTGFAAGAVEYARDEGIELREVRSLAATEFEDWLQITTLHQRMRIADLQHASIFI